MKTESVKAWELERYLLGELPRKRMEEIGRILGQDAELSGQLAALQKSGQDILQAYPPETVIPGIQRKFQGLQVREETRPRSKAVRRLLYASPVLVSALVFLFIVVFKAPVSEDTRIKGPESVDLTKSQLLIYRKANDEVHLMRNGDSAHRGDLLQVAYVSAGDPCGVIFSIDGSGAVTLHYPDDDLSPAVLQPNKQVPLKTSYELDDAPEFERFFFITAPSEIDVAAILRQAERLAEKPERARLAALDLPKTYGQYSVLIKKGE